MRARLFRIPPGVCATLLLLAGLAAAISALYWWPPSLPELWLVMIGLVVPPLWAGWLLLRRRRWVTAVLGVGLLAPGALGVAGILTGAYHYVSRGGVWASLESRERHAVPDSRSIALTYVTQPARTAQPADPIVYLAGGPGGSAMLTPGDVNHGRAEGILEQRQRTLQDAWLKTPNALSTDPRNPRPCPTRSGSTRRTRKKLPRRSLNHEQRCLNVLDRFRWAYTPATR